MADAENQLTSPIPALFAMRLVTVRFSKFFPRWIRLIWSLAEFTRSILLSENQLNSSDSHDSHGVYDVPLGLYPHLRNGGRSCLEIKVELHEGPVPFSALHALYRSHLDFSRSSVWYVSYRPMLIFIGRMGDILTEAGCRKLSQLTGGL